MRRMARNITDEHHTGSSFSVGNASSALRKKFNINWIQLNFESNDLACSSTCLSQPMPIEANRATPTEAELCLLICSLFPIDFRLPIEDLVMYGMTLKLFKDVHDISEGRCRVHGLIKIINHQLSPRYLSKLCVWEDEYGSQYVKVFDCAKNLAKSIASKYQLVLGGNEIVNGKWPNTNWYEYLYGLSHVLERIDEHPINLECPYLALLKFQHMADSQSIFEGFKELMTLSLDVVPSLPESLHLFFNLRTLCLNILKMEDLSWIGRLTNLELLLISTPSLTDIPKEMGQLGKLRLLDLRKMSIAYIPPGVLSRMVKLEELYFPLSFQRWGCKEKDLDDYDEWESREKDDYDDKERIGASNNQIKRINASISEITSLSLHALEISIPDASVLSKNSSMFINIRQFKIFVPNNFRYKPPGKLYSTNLLQLTGDAYDIKVSGICNLMSRTEDLSLVKVRNLKNIMFQLQDYGFPKLQKMIISECDQLEHVVDTTRRTLTEFDCLFSKLETLHLSMLPNLKEIWHGRSASLQRFENLSQISIRFCHKLKYVFPLSVVRGSIHLKSIQILNCIEMGGILYQDKDDDLVLYSIEELHLHSLPKLVGFLLSLDDKISGFRDDTDQFHTTNEILSSSMEGPICTFESNFQSFSTDEKASRVNERCTDDGEVICQPPIALFRGNSEENVSHQLVSSQLASFTMNKDVIGCTEKYVAFMSSKFAEKWMQELRRLEITFCDAIQVIFSFEENHVVARAFSSLIELKLCGLQNLEHIWFQVPPEMIAFQNLQLLVLSECRNMYLFSPRVAKLLVQLRKIYINQCEKMEEVIAKENEESVEKIVFPQLQFLEFEYIPNLKAFYSGIYSIELPLLESLELNQCNKVEYFSYKSLMTPMLKRIQINGSFCALTGDLNTTIMRYTRNCFGTPAADDNPSTTINSYSPDEQDGYNELHGTSDEQDGSHSDDEFDGYGELDWLDEIELSDNTTSVDISASKAIEEANQSYMKEFTFADLKIATNNFSSDALLGKGGFGYVYKGWLDERTFSPSKTGTGMAVAIKKMKPNTKQGTHQWQMEVHVLERQCHPNLIKLIGYCREDEELLLVYEFMQKGSLDNLLSRRNLGIEPLSWELRLKMAIGAARGLMFLHTLEKKVIHRDFNPSNILIDGNYNSKIADFGLAVSRLSDGDSYETTMNCNANLSDLGPARLVPSECSYRSTEIKGTFGYIDPEYYELCGDSHVTTRAMGTYGYAAPEYLATGHLHVRSDVYGFGVVLLQLMTGLRAIDRNRPSGQHNLVDWLKPILLNRRKLKKVMDKRVEGQYSSKAMMLAARLCLKCINGEHISRPFMKEVVEALEQIYAIKKHKFQFLKFLALSPH